MWAWPVPPLGQKFTSSIPSCVASVAAHSASRNKRHLCVSRAEIGLCVNRHRVVSCVDPKRTSCIAAEMLVGRQGHDPYVRKNAAVCTAKLYDVTSQLVENRGFLDILKVRIAFCISWPVIPPAARFSHLAQTASRSGHHPTYFVHVPDLLLPSVILSRGLDWGRSGR